MTAAQIIAVAQNNINATSDTFWSESEILYDLFLVEMYLARRARCITALTTSATSTASTADYTKPTSAFEIWRITYAGTKLQYLDLRTRDSINPNSSTGTGTPSYYSYYGSTYTLYPTPNTTGDAIHVWSYKLPTLITLTSTTPDTPAEYHDVLCDGLTARMCPKDTGHPLTSYWLSLFRDGVKEVESTEKRKKRGDRFGIVKIEDELITSEFGIV